jgi:hypothetical protein
MIDSRLGRHSVATLSLGVLPAAMVVVIFADGMAHPGTSHSAGARVAVFATPPLAGFVLTLVDRRRLLPAVAMSAAALCAIAAWYAVLLLPAAAICSAAAGDSCM